MTDGILSITPKGPNGHGYVGDCWWCDRWCVYVCYDDDVRDSVKLAVQLVGEALAEHAVGCAPDLADADQLRRWLSS